MAVKKKSINPKTLDREATKESIAQAAAEATGKKRLPGWASKKRIQGAVKDVEIEFTGEPIPLAPKPGRGQVGGLREFPIEGSEYSLLCMEEPLAVPTLDQRRMMAQRLIEVGPKLPRYFKSVRMGAHMFHSKNDPTNSDHVASKARAEAEEKGEPALAARTARVKRLAEAKEKKADGIPNGVPLKKVCAAVNLDPKIARRILRSKGQKPGGRWEWTKEEATKIEELLKVEYEKLKKAGKV